MTLYPSTALLLAAATVAAVSGCAVQVTPMPQYVAVRPTPMPTTVPTVPMAVVSVYIDPPLEQPAPVIVAWAPPPMLVEAPPPMPFADANWIGGFWTWQGNWVWASGRWSAPPRPHYHWVHPYYEHREEVVIFIGGHWCAPGVEFVAPSPRLHLELEVVARGVTPGPRPIGPMGVFVPAPPGSRPGIIVPAPIGTAPAVVMSAPPVMNVGMRVQTNVNNSIVNNTTINNNRITNITNVTVIAPATATASGRPYQANVPAQAHLAAALPPLVHVPAPAVVTKPLPPVAPAPSAAPAVDRPVAQPATAPAPSPTVNAQIQATHDKPFADKAAQGEPVVHAPAPAVVAKPSPPVAPAPSAAPAVVRPVAQPATAPAPSPVVNAQIQATHDKPIADKAAQGEPVVQAPAPAVTAKPLPPVAPAPSASAPVVRPVAKPASAPAVNTRAQATHDKPVADKMHSESAAEKE